MFKEYLCMMCVMCVMCVMYCVFVNPELMLDTGSLVLYIFCPCILTVKEHEVCSVHVFGAFGKSGNNGKNSYM